jgi:hypothetical protein
VPEDNDIPSVSSGVVSTGEISSASELLTEDEPSFRLSELPDSNRVADKWGNQSLIGVKAVSPIKSLSPDDRSTQPQGRSNGPFGGKALPGMVAKTPLSPAQEQTHSSQVMGCGTLPESTLPASLQAIKDERPKVEKEEKSPVSPTRHTRIPSTGNRATVMDVAQALNNPQQVLSTASRPAMVTQPRYVPPFEDNPAENAVPIPRASHPTSSGVSSERRRSNYERYSAVMLPPVVEENTPVPSPAATMSRTADIVNLGVAQEGSAAPVPLENGTDSASTAALESKEPIGQVPSEWHLISLSVFRL